MSKGSTVPPEATAQRVRVGSELRRLRVLAGVSGEQVARTLGWSQSKVSRIEGGLHSITVKDVAGLLEVYGVSDDARAELLGATAADNGEGAWIVRANGFPGRLGAMPAPESPTARVRHHQPVVLPGLLQTREYARTVIKAAGDDDPDARAEAQMRRQEILTATNGPQYDVVLDARALLLAVGPVDLIRDQILSLAVRAQRLRRLDLRVIPIAQPSPAFSTVGFTLYDFHATESAPVARIESPTGDAYFSAPEDIRRYATLFERLQGVALGRLDSVRYLRSLAADVDRYLGKAAPDSSDA
jgi:transcriptional regulator with XRE-family HTH domain